MAIPLGQYPVDTTVTVLRCPACGGNYNASTYHSCIGTSTAASYPPYMAPTATADQVSQLSYEMNGRLRDLEISNDRLHQRIGELNALLYDLLTTLKEIKR